MLSTMHCARMFLLLNKLVMSGSMAGKGQSRIGDDLWLAGGCAGLKASGSMAGGSSSSFLFFLHRIWVFEKHLFVHSFIHSLNPGLA